MSNKKYTIENVGTGTELAKQFYLDGVVLKKECTCGEMMEYNLGEHYLSYPSVGYPDNLYMYCEACETEHENALQVTVLINLEVEEL